MRRRIAGLLLLMPLLLGACGHLLATTPPTTVPAVEQAAPAIDERLLRVPDTFSWDSVDLEALSPG